MNDYDWFAFYGMLFVVFLAVLFYVSLRFGIPALIQIVLDAWYDWRHRNDEPIKASEVVYPGLFPESKQDLEPKPRIEIKKKKRTPQYRIKRFMGMWRLYHFKGLQTAQGDLLEWEHWDFRTYEEAWEFFEAHTRNLKIMCEKNLEYFNAELDKFKEKNDD